LHTWSLAIEEQYYLVFPIFMVLFWALGRRWLVAIISSVAVISLLLAQIGGNLNFSAPYIDRDINWFASPKWSFYFPISRAWELMIGALVAFCLHSRDPRSAGIVNQVGAGVGGVLIAYSIFAFDSSMPSPSIYTLIPTLGTMLIIFFATPNTLVNKILSMPVFVQVGLVSYSAYLWHQPLFAFARLSNFNKPSPWLFAVLSVMAVVLAFVSWRYIELPFRNRQKVSRPQVLLSAAVVGAVMMVVCLVVHFSGGFSSRFSKVELNAVYPKKRVGATSFCDWKKISPAFPGRQCYFGAMDTGNITVLYGDSHAVSLIYTLHRLFKSSGIKGIYVNNRDCRVIPHIYRHDELSMNLVNRCSASNRLLISYIKSLRPRTIIVAMRWTMTLYPVPGLIDKIGYDNGEGGVEYRREVKHYALKDNKFVKSGEAKSHAISRLIRDLMVNTTRLILIYPIPETGWDIPELNAKHILFNNKIPENISTSSSRYYERNRFVISSLDAIGEHPDLFRLKPADILCDTFIENRCVAQLDRVPLYFDDNHLSEHGSMLLVNEALKHIN